MRTILGLALMATIVAAPALTLDESVEPAPRTVDHCEPDEVHVDGVGCVDPTPCPPTCRVTPPES